MSNTVVAEMAAWLSKVVTEDDPHPGVVYRSDGNLLHLFIVRSGVIKASIDYEDGHHDEVEWDLQAGPAPAKLMEWMENFKLQTEQDDGLSTPSANG